MCLFSNGAPFPPLFPPSHTTTAFIYVFYFGHALGFVFVLLLCAFVVLPWQYRLYGEGHCAADFGAGEAGKKAYTHVDKDLALPE